MRALKPGLLRSRAERLAPPAQAQIARVIMHDRVSKCMRMCLSVSMRAWLGSRCRSGAEQAAWRAQQHAPSAPAPAGGSACDAAAGDAACDDVAMEDSDGEVASNQSGTARAAPSRTVQTGAASRAATHHPVR
jgi:hypothetical protein